MKALALALLFALAQTMIPPPPKACSAPVGYFGSNATFYACATGAMAADRDGVVNIRVDTPVSKTWFKAHCTTKGADTAHGDVAVCDAYAVADPALTAKDAAGPSKLKRRVTEIAVVGVGVLIVFACAAGGGCAFAGGGL